MNKKLLRERAMDSFSVVTEMADTIVRITDLPFRTAHHVVSALVKKVIASGGGLSSIDEKLFRSVYDQVAGEPFTGDYGMIRKSLDPDHFVSIREVPGGVGPKAMESMLASARSKVENWHTWYNESIRRIEQADASRMKAVGSILNG